MTKKFYWHPVQLGDAWFVREVRPEQHGGSHLITGELTEEQARLIAHAPDMLEAMDGINRYLDGLVGLARSDDGLFDRRSRVRSVRSAIWRAHNWLSGRGEEP